MPASGQARTPAKPPLASNCSKHQAACRPARTTTSRSGATPAAAQAGACGSQGGATSASQPPAADNWASAGSNRLISPRPPRSTRNSVRFPRGQPPPGNSASSSGWPLGMVASGRLASVSPRQTSPLASTSARATGNGARAHDKRADRPANQADGNAFDGEIDFARIDDDRLEIRVLGNQFDKAAAMLQALDGDFLVEPGDDDLAVARLVGLVHGEQVAVEDAGIDHRQAAHLEQVIGARAEQLGIQRVAALHVLDGEDRRAGGDAADQRQAELLDQPDAACRTGFEDDGAFLGERLEVIFRRIGRSEAEGAGNFHARRRRPEHLERAADEIENFLLTWREFHGRLR